MIHCNKLIVITGYTSISCFEIAAHFLSKKYNIAIASHDISLISQDIKTLKTQFPESRIYSASVDMYAEYSVDYFFSYINDNFGTINGIINNLPIPSSKLYNSNYQDCINTIFDNYLKGIVYAAYSSLDQIKGQNTSILNLAFWETSKLDHLSLEKSSVSIIFSSIKRLTKTLATELDFYDVRVNCIVKTFTQDSKYENSLFSSDKTLDSLLAHNIYDLFETSNFKSFSGISISI